MGQESSGGLQVGHRRVHVEFRWDTRKFMWSSGGVQVEFRWDKTVQVEFRWGAEKFMRSSGGTPKRQVHVEFRWSSGSSVWARRISTKPRAVFTNVSRKNLSFVSKYLSADPKPSFKPSQCIGDFGNSDRRNPFQTLQPRMVCPHLDGSSLYNNLKNRTLAQTPTPPPSRGQTGRAVAREHRNFTGGTGGNVMWCGVVGWGGVGWVGAGWGGAWSVAAKMSGGALEPNAFRMQIGTNFSCNSCPQFWD